MPMEAPTPALRLRKTNPRSRLLSFAQLVSFVIRSKSLQFITTGLISGVIAFIKLYMCVTDVVPDGAPSQCSQGSSAPGGHATFLFEVVLIFMRTVLVWITFAFIKNLEALTAWKRERDAMNARLATKPRHGLLARNLRCVISPHLPPSPDVSRLISPSPAFSRLLPPSPALSRLVPPCPACSRLL